MLHQKQQHTHSEDVVAEVENTNPSHGRPWTDHSVHVTHTAAVAAKEHLESDSMQVKIRRTAENRFKVKTRSSVQAAAKETKSNPTAVPKSRSARRKEKAARHKARQEKD